MTSLLAALEALGRSDWSPARDEMWTLPSYHVDGLHPEAARQLRRVLAGLARGDRAVGAVLRGPPGSGKTHLLSWLREQIQADGGFFVVLSPAGDHVADILDGLQRRAPGGGNQLGRLLGVLADRAGLDGATRAAVTGRGRLARSHLDTLAAAVRPADLGETARALALIASPGPESAAGRDFLAGSAGPAAWGLGAARPRPEVLRDLLRLLALGGPVVLAVDDLVPEARDQIAVMLAEAGSRTLIVVACRDTWPLPPGPSRFAMLPELGTIPDPAIAAAIVGARFRPRYAAMTFAPPYPTWPVTAAALDEAAHHYTARRLLLRVHDHIAACVAAGTVAELTTLAA